MEHVDAQRLATDETVCRGDEDPLRFLEVVDAP